MKNYYTEHSDEFGWGIKQGIPQYKINELLPLVSGNRILDIGCGPGAFVDVLASRGFEATGIDLTPKFISFAKKNYQGKFLVGDALSLPFENKSFDTVFIRNVIEHLENDLGAIKEALRVGHKVVIIVPHQTPLALKKHGLIFSHYQDTSHLRTYTKKSLLEITSQAKGELVDFFEIEKLPNTSIAFELLSGPSILKKIALKLLFGILPATAYYLELIAIIKS